MKKKKINEREREWEREPQRWWELWKEIRLSSMKRVYYHIHPITPVKPLVIGSDHGSIAFNITWPYLVLHFFFQRKLEESFNLIIQLLQEWRTNSMIYQLRNNNMTTIRLFTWDESDNIFSNACSQVKFTKTHEFHQKWNISPNYHVC